MSASSALRAIASACLVVVLGACQLPPSASPRTAKPVSDPAADAQRAFERRDWAVAAPRLREAIARDPDSVTLHFRLAICATWLDARDEATREFEWVREHTSPDSQEHRAARHWLTEAGVLQGFTLTTASVAEPSHDNEDIAVTESGLTGQVIWAEPGSAPVPQQRRQLHLMGMPGTPSQGMSYTIRSDEHGRYEFGRVIPGPYKLTDAIVTPVWRLKVLVERGKRTVLDLMPANTVQTRDDFPG